MVKGKQLKHRFEFKHDLNCWLFLLSLDVKCFTVQAMLALNQHLENKQTSKQKKYRE